MHFVGQRKGHWRDIASERPWSADADVVPEREDTGRVEKRQFCRLVDGPTCRMNCKYIYNIYIYTKWKDMQASVSLTG